MLVVARADDRRVAVRVRERVSKDQFGPRHSTGKKIVKSRLRPDVVERGSLDLGIGAAVGDAAPDDDARPAFCGSRDPIVMLGSQAGVGDLERVEHAEVNQRREVRQ